MIKIYSSDDCGYCRELKAYLDKKGVKYDVADVKKSEENAKELYRISGQSAIPVSVIDGNVIIGFDRKKIDALLG